MGRKSRGKWERRALGAAYSKYDKSDRAESTAHRFRVISYLGGGAWNLLPLGTNLIFTVPIIEIESPGVCIGALVTLTATGYARYARLKDKSEGAPVKLGDHGELVPAGGLIAAIPPGAEAGTASNETGAVL